MTMITLLLPVLFIENNLIVNDDIAESNKRKIVINHGWQFQRMGVFE